MKIVAIIQARMKSTRLPGKVLKDICGRTMLARVVCRTQRAKLLDEVIIATTVGAADHAIVSECKRLGMPVFRGSELDVLDRYYGAALAHGAEVIVRITSDCPLIDPEIIDKVIHTFLKEKADYASNTIVRTYPHGLDTEVMANAALARAWREATEPYQREHVTPYIYQNPQLFRLISLANEVDYSYHRWTVDTPEDLELVRAVYSRIDSDSSSWQDVLKIFEREPDLIEINRHIKQKILEEG